MLCTHYPPYNSTDPDHWFRKAGNGCIALHHRLVEFVNYFPCWLPWNMPLMLSLSHCSLRHSWLLVGIGVLENFLHVLLVCYSNIRKVLRQLFIYKDCGEWVHCNVLCYHCSALSVDIIVIYRLPVPSNVLNSSYEFDEDEEDVVDELLRHCK